MSRSAKNLFLIIGLSVIIASGLCGPVEADEGDVILETGERFFKSLKARDFSRAWGLLSQESKDRIVLETLQGMDKGSPGKVTREQLIAEFSQGKGFALLYWEGFLQVFEPDKALEKSRWTVDSIKGGNAEIHIYHRKVQRPARLKMVREDGQWKVGLFESFWK
jgi:hypothetical protein